MYDAQSLTALPLLLDAAAGGDERALSILASLAIFFAADDSFALSLYDVISCADQVAFSDQVAFAQLFNGTDRVVEAFLPLSASDPFVFCSQVPVVSQPDWLSQPLQGSSVPVLTLAGSFDPVTPPRYALEVAEQLGGSALVFPTLGHATFTDPCAASIIIIFFDTFNGSSPGSFDAADADSCIAELDELVFVPPASFTG